MTVDLVPAPTDEQAMLVDASVRFMESEHPLSTVRRCADGETYDDEAYRHTAAELGWFGLLADEAHGGGSMSGNGLLDAALIAAERGARLQPGPFVGHNVVVHALTIARSQPAVIDELVERRGVGDVDRGLRALVHRAHRRRRAPPHRHRPGGGRRRGVHVAARRRGR